MATPPLTSTVCCLMDLGWLVNTVFPNHASVPSVRKNLTSTPSQWETEWQDHLAAGLRVPGGWAVVRGCGPAWFLSFLFQVLSGSRVFPVD